MSQFALDQEMETTNNLAKLVEEGLEKLIHHYSRRKWNTSKSITKMDTYDSYITQVYSLRTKYEKMLKAFQNTRKLRSRIAQLLAKLEGRKAPKTFESLSDTSEDEESTNEPPPTKKRFELQSQDASLRPESSPFDQACHQQEIAN